MLTNSQDQALKLIKQWIASGGRLFRLGGPAGSGKSFIIPLVCDIVGIEHCVLMTPTGKVANNLQKAGLTAKTIHSTIYRVKDDERPDDDDDEKILDVNSDLNYEEDTVEFQLKGPKDFVNVKLFIVDEGSMVGGKLLQDILSMGVPTLLVGDPNQLRPVNDTSVFLQCDFYLTEIVRQAQESPIIWLSQRALDGNISPGCAGTCMVREGPVSDAELMHADVVLADTNSYRTEYNNRLRNLKLSADIANNPGCWIIPGDRVICRSNVPDLCSTAGFMLTNGTLGDVTDVKRQRLGLAQFTLDAGDLGVYDLEGTMWPLKFPKKRRPPTVEYGYALTVHLSQGSEWPNVIYQMGMAKDRRAVYTAITRAKESILLAY